MLAKLGGRASSSGRSARRGWIGRSVQCGRAADPAAELRRVCGFASLGYDEGMLGYEVAVAGHDGRRLAAYDAKTWAWHSVGVLAQRSPLWRRRHPLLGEPGERGV